MIAPPSPPRPPPPHRLKLLGGAAIEAPDGAPLTGRAVQRHRLALLAVLTTGRAAGTSRDKLMALLWPEVDGERGRRLLSDSVYRINQALGEAIVSAGDALRLDPRALPSDVADFESALARDDRESAAAAYGGPFLDGFFLPDSPEFERWLDGERSRLARAYAAALEALAERSEAAGDRARAVEWWRRLAAHDPYASRVALRLMQALEAAGERAAALQHARLHGTLLQQELEAEPDPAVAALAERIRSAAASATDSRSPAAAPPEPLPEALPATPTLDRAQPALEPAREHRPVEPTRPRRTALAAALLLLIGALLVTGLTWRVLRRDADRAASGAARSAIAVLPFADLSPGRDNEYFSDGMTEELIDNLNKVEGLRVASRTSVFAYKGKSVDVREVARQLGVGAILEGSVRKAGNKLRVTAQLVSAADGYQLWSETYEREMEDVFQIQEDISRSIVGMLRGRLVVPDTARIGERATDDPRAYDLYLKGRYFWHQRTEEGVRRAAESFSAAVALAPGYARAHVGLGDAYAIMGFYDYLPPREAFPRARSAAEHALELAPQLAEPHATLGYVALYFEWDWPRAEREFRRAIALDPSYSTAHQWYANFLTAMGRFDEAEREMRRAQELDPLSLIANAALGWTLHYAGHYERAIEQCRRTLELNPDFALAHLWSGMALERLGRTDEAIRALERAEHLSRGSAISLAAIAHVHATAGSRDRARAELARLEAATRGGYAPAYEIAKVHLALGDRAQSFAWLERALSQRSHSLVFLKVDPQLAPLRGDPRFAELVRQVGLK